MSNPKVMDGGDSLQMGGGCTNILNKQLQTANKGSSSSLEVGYGANNSPSKISLLQKSHKASDLDGFFG
jgi:hypothetical protein